MLTWSICFRTIRCCQILHIGPLNVSCACVPDFYLCPDIHPFQHYSIFSNILFDKCKIVDATTSFHPHSIISNSVVRLTLTTCWALIYIWPTNNYRAYRSGCKTEPFSRFIRIFPFLHHHYTQFSCMLANKYSQRGKNIIKTSQTRQSWLDEGNLILCAAMFVPFSSVSSRPV